MSDCPAAITTFLLSAGADANAKSNRLFTPLHLAAREGNTPVVRALIAAGAETVVCDDGLMTPLRQGRKERDVVHVLLQAVFDESLEAIM